MTEREHLLEEVMAEGLPADFRAALLSATLHTARRRQLWRQTRRGAVVLALLALAAVLLRPRLAAPPQSLPEARQPFATIVRTRRLPMSALVRTQPLPADQFVTTARSAWVVETSVGASQLRTIDDAELLRLIEPRPVALVRRSPGTADLVFLNPSDRRGLLGE